jgi:hypothetical protein
MKLSRKKFFEWLSSNSDLEFDRQHAGACPLAIFLGGGCDKVVSVSKSVICIDGRSSVVPYWVERFIDGVDAVPGRITSKEALEFL